MNDYQIQNAPNLDKLHTSSTTRPATAEDIKIFSVGDWISERECPWSWQFKQWDKDKCIGTWEGKEFPIRRELLMVCEVIEGKVIEKFRNLNIGYRANIKALSLHQPWAELIALGLKRFETRSWSTNYRGELLICSAKLKELEQKSTYEWLKDKYFPNHSESFDSLRFGSAIALVDLTDCILMDEAFIQSQNKIEIDCGDWAVGRYAWKLENIRLCIPVINVKGKQGFFNLDLELSDQDLEINEDGNGKAYQLRSESLNLSVRQQGAKFCTHLKLQKPVLPDNAPIAVILFAGGGGIEAGMVEAGIRPVIFC